MAPPGQPRTPHGLPAGYLYVLGLWFALLYDVAASMVLTVAAAAIYSELEVAASFWPAVAAAAPTGGGELARWGACRLVASPFSL